MEGLVCSFLVLCVWAEHHDGESLGWRAFFTPIRQNKEKQGRDQGHETRKYLQPMT